MRTYEQIISKGKNQCDVCGLIEGNCLCTVEVNIESAVEFWLLTHEAELKRTNNTGRLIERAVEHTRVFRWHRTEWPEELIRLIQSNRFNVYIIFSDDREEEKKRVKSFTPSDKKTVFLIIDGTWKEARKMIRKSPYLNGLPILPLSVETNTKYTLRRNSDAHHLCTVEVGIELLKIAGENNNALKLESYYEVFLLKYHQGKYNHGEKND